MSKYDKLWLFLSEAEKPSLTLSFAEIETVAGVAIDHSFLQAKKELTAYGWQVGKISMKNQTVLFNKIT